MPEPESKKKYYLVFDMEANGRGDKIEFGPFSTEDQAADFLERLRASKVGMRLEITDITTRSLG